MTTRHRAPLHPGEVLREEVVKPLDMSVNQLALALGIGATRLNEVVRGRRGITADTALRLARYLGSDPQFCCKRSTNWILRQPPSSRRSSAGFSRGKRRPEDLLLQSSATERCASSPNRGSG